MRNSDDATHYFKGMLEAANLASRGLDVPGVSTASPAPNNDDRVDADATTGAGDPSLSGLESRHEKAKRVRNKRQSEYAAAERRRQEEREKKQAAKANRAAKREVQKKRDAEEERLIALEADKIKDERKQHREIMEEAERLLAEEDEVLAPVMMVTMPRPGQPPIQHTAAIPFQEVTVGGGGGRGRREFGALSLSPVPAASAALPLQQHLRAPPPHSSIAAAHLATTVGGAAAAAAVALADARRVRGVTPTETAITISHPTPLSPSSPTTAAELGRHCFTPPTHTSATAGGSRAFASGPRTSATASGAPPRSSGSLPSSSSDRPARSSSGGGGGGVHTAVAAGRRKHTSASTSTAGQIAEQHRQSRLQELAVQNMLKTRQLKALRKYFGGWRNLTT